MTVWIVSLEWNFAPSEVTGDTGIVGVFTNEAAAKRCARDARVNLDGGGIAVADFTSAEGRYCPFCGEPHLVAPDGTFGPCSAQSAHGADEGWCDACGAELTERGSCDNDHDEWDIDVHVTEHEVKA